MGNIVLLDELTINQIAAGEVIERPASVVKEMVENSIDAGATNITVEIKNGGISYIKIVDNGKGIREDDLEIAFERHATSKIRSAKDLSTVTSMGFRGEALASISSIANVELVTKTKDKMTGNKIVVEAGNILRKEECACQQGTSITVTNLFFNTPVRYKFLRKDYTEAGYIEDAVTRIALVNPGIAIKLISSGKTIIQTSGSGDLKNVVYSIYGKDVANGTLEVEYKLDDYKIHGVIGKPEISRSNRANQMFFVNKRFVKDKTLTAATEQGFKGMIPHGKFAFLILNIEMNPAKVDVNVHPAKLEVRFEEDNKVFQTVYHGIKETFEKRQIVSSEKTEEILTNRMLSFEERLKQIRENKKDSTNPNIFGRKIEKLEQPESIEKVVDRTNEEIEKEEVQTKKEKNSRNIIEEVYNRSLKLREDSVDSNVDVIKDKNKEYLSGIGNPINTSEVLLKLKQMKESIQNELEQTKSKEEDKKIYLNNNLEKVLEETKENENEEKIIRRTSIEVEENQEIETFHDAGSQKVSSEDINYEEEIKNKIDGIISQIEHSKEIVESKNENEELNQDEVEKIEENQEIIKQNFEEIKTKMEELTDNPRIVSEDFNEMYSKIFGKLPSTEQQEEIEVINETGEEIDFVQETMLDMKEKDLGYSYQIPAYKFVGIVFNTYIVLEIEKEMYILDQHAAHERIMYEKVKHNYYSDYDKDSQMLLLPDVITLTHKEMDIAKENMSMFNRAGFTLEIFGDTTIKLTGVPTVCFNLDTKELFLESLDEINTVARTAKQEKEEKFISTVACKASVKANMCLNEKEVSALMDKLLILPNPFSCPHGRPTVIKMSKIDIEKKFARR